MVELCEEEPEALKRRVLEVIEGIEGGRFEATPDYNTCKWCDDGELCGEG